MEKNQPKNFILRIPLKVLLNIKNPAKRDVFLAVYSFTDNGQGECFASHREIAKRCACSRASVDRYLPILVKDDYFKVARTVAVKGGIINVYALSGTERATKPAEVAHCEEQVAHTAKHKQLKETAATLPSKKKPIKFEPSYSKVIGLLEDKSYLQRKRKDYPFLDVKIEVENAADWLLDSGQERKNPRSFVNNWLKKAARDYAEKGGQKDDWRNKIPSGEDIPDPLD